MSPTIEQQAWVDRVLYGGTQTRDRHAADLVELEFESKTLRSSSRATPKDLNRVSNLFIRLPSIVNGAANTGSLSTLSKLNTKTGGSAGGQVEGALTKDLPTLGPLFQEAFASAIAAAPGDTLSQLAVLGAGAPDGSNGAPRALPSQLSGIEDSFKQLQTSIGKLNDVSALSALSALQTATG